MNNKKILGYVFLIILSLSFTNALTGFDTLKIINFTATYGFNVTNNMTCSDATWKITDTECNFGRCLRRLKGTSYTYADCRFKDSWANIDPTKTYLIRGWMEDEFVSNNGGYIAIGTFNTSSSKVNQLGYHCESPRLFTFINGTGPTQRNSFTKSPCGDVPIWFEVTLNATSNQIGERICSDQTCSSVLKQNYSVMEYQNFNKNWLAVSAGRDVNFGLIEFYTLSTADTTPPVITNIKQYPTNASFLNLATQHLLLNATITDNVKLKYANVSLKLNRTKVYFNGKLVNFNLTYKNMSTSGSTHLWDFDEMYLLSGYYPLNFTIFENTKHSNYSLDNNQKLVKMMFKNVSASVQANLLEIYAQNTTTSGTTQYFYCNSSYTTGNPTTSNKCYQFYTININRPFNHTHGNGNSKHKVIPLGINTTNGKIGNVKVTETSYIVKRVTQGTEAIFYVPNISSTTQSQYSTNLGNTYSNIVGTIDAHIHPLDSLSSINYKFCSQDSSGNNACTSWYSDIYENPKLPPSSIIFSVPTTTYYNTSMNLAWSPSFSSTGQSIINYTLYYAEENSTTFTEISTILHPITTYEWDISLLTDSAYYLKGVTKDSLGYSSTSYSDVFYIRNPIDLNTALLTNIDLTLTDMLQVIKMLGVIFIYLTFMFISWNMIRHGQYIPGMVLWIMSIGFDFLLVGYLIEFTSSLSGGEFYTSMIAIFQVFLFIWLVGKFLILTTFKTNRSVM